MFEKFLILELVSKNGPANKFNYLDIYKYLWSVIPVTVFYTTEEGVVIISSLPYPYLQKNQRGVAYLFMI